MRHRAWLPEDDANLRKFYDEGKIDADIAYILGRSHSSIARHRRAFGLQAKGKPGSKKGSFNHTDEAKAKIGAATRIRWETDENYRVSTMATLQQGRRNSQYNGWHIPTEPDARRYYFKVRKLFGSKYARTAVAEIMSKEASPAG